MAHRGPASFCREDLKVAKGNKTLLQEHTNSSAKHQFNFTQSLKAPFRAGLHTELLGEASGALFGVLSIQEAAQLWQFP